MRARWLARGLGLWALALALSCVAVHCAFRIDPAPMPSKSATDWALGALHAARLGHSVPEPPEAAEQYRAAGPVFVMGWWKGTPLLRHAGSRSIAETVRAAIEAFDGQDTLRQVEGWDAARDAPDRVRFSITITRGEGPVVLGVPYLSALNLVPMHEGLAAHFEGESAYLTPEELKSEQAYDEGIPTPVPDLTLGVKMRALVDRLARELGTDVHTLVSEGEVRRLRASTVAEAEYPNRDVEVTEQALRRAAAQGAEFLLRHQHESGKYTYIYDARRAQEAGGRYNLPRHAGTTWFLALVDRIHGMPEARQGAIEALEWIRQHAIRHCGGTKQWCVTRFPKASVGAAALTTVAAADVLQGGDHPLARTMVERLTAFLRAQQREDGELMHEYDLREQQPIDIQHMYYSGEAAFALLKAHRVLGDERNLKAARRLMKHLTGEGWDFLGSRYYYGEEHWTCIAAGEGADRLGSTKTLDFCRRWAQYNRQLQYRKGETPWDVRGAYGAGPLIVPRMTPVGSRTEAFISTYAMAKRAGEPTGVLRAQIERGLSMLLRWRWDPGPTHLFAEPSAAEGGIPESPVSLQARNDFVQHGGAAMIRWARVLQREDEGQSGEGRDTPE